MWQGDAAGQERILLRDRDRLVTDIAPMLAQQLRPGEVADVEHRVVRDERRARDQPVEHAAEMLADADDQRPAGFRRERRAGPGATT